MNRYLEDFNVGDVYRARLGRTVTEYDNISFTLLTGNTNQIHFNRHYAQQLPWRRCLVNGALTMSIIAGLGVVDVSENGFGLGWDGIELVNPVFAGDTLYSESEVLAVRESRSDPTKGIVKVESRGFNQDGVLVIKFVRSVMVWKRGSAPQRNVFPEPSDPSSTRAEADDIS